MIFMYIITYFYMVKYIFYMLSHNYDTTLV
jgi:hypothetical protein